MSTLSKSSEKVYLLTHLHVFESGEEDIKIIGIYSSNANAELAAGRLSQKSGFKDYPRIIDPDKEDELVSGFYISDIEMDKDQWRTGFVTVD